MGKKLNFKYKVLIASAGLGNRLKGMTKNVNKALISIAHKPAISYIIEKFDIDIEIIIAVGYKANLIKDYISIAYPNRKITFVDVDKFEGEGSGLGYSIMKCEKHLQCPFIFSSNDTIVIEDIKPPTFNWMGQTDLEDNSQYRSIVSKNNQVKELRAKNYKGDSKAYIGLAGIFNYKEFWSSMKSGINEGSIIIGESFGLRNLISKNISLFDFSWFDTGNLDQLNKTREFFSKNNNYNILEKEEEAIWFQQDKVIKFSIDKIFIKNRVRRSSSLGKYIPSIISSSENMFAYKKIEGDVFSKLPTEINLKFFLNWIEEFWQKKELNTAQEKDFFSTCDIFYKEKTYKRVKLFFTELERFDVEENINGIQTPKIFDLLDIVDWTSLSKGIPVRFHGDLHFENILINKNSDQPFTLLDWRQDFGGNMEYGDIYYDLAKLNHGFIISHKIIDEELFNVETNLDHIKYDFHRTQNLIDCEKYFKDWVIEKGFNYSKVELLTSLIFLNIAVLHHYPYNKLLFYLGKSMLYKYLRPGENNK
jgi:NDP-sugar pyrophosphorylase family protein